MQSIAVPIIAALMATRSASSAAYKREAWEVYISVGKCVGREVCGAVLLIHPTPSSRPLPPSSITCRSASWHSHCRNGGVGSEPEAEVAAAPLSTMRLCVRAAAQPPA